MKPILLVIAAASIFILPVHKVKPTVKSVATNKHTGVRVAFPKTVIKKVPVAAGTANNTHFLHDIFLLAKF